MAGTRRTTRRTASASGSRPRPSRRGASSRRRFGLILAIVLPVALVVAVILIARLSRVPRFDGERALEDIRRQVAFGPRTAGSRGHARQLEWMESTLRPLADSVYRQPFVWVHPQDSTVTMAGTNLVASFGLRPARSRRALFAAHFDTRPTADRDPNPEGRAYPVPGANDGGSGVAVLLELARILADRPPDDLGVDLAFFDLEDVGSDSAAAGPTIPFAIGSEAFVARNPGYRPAWGVLLDMVCDRRLRIPREAYSQANAPRLNDRVWAAAGRAGAAAFVDDPGGAVVDDHIAFLRAGIPMVDIIHQPFPVTWHTTADLPDACRAESLAQVGQTLVEMVWGEE
jgi:glutaminyl-peptide cyclotransferase